MEEPKRKNSNKESRMNKELLTPQELASELGVKLSTVYYWSHIGYVPCVKLGKHLRFRRSTIEKWLETKESKVTQRVIKIL
ncbi:MAG: helix-turn-helix domain-containing protein [candidate division Zixibacteria bacterium]|nr:helix-turn-helix domain-containing protein [candidate division Zixibacteria bacterium]